MKGRQIVLGELFGAEAAALVVDGQLTDLIADASLLTPLVPGAICRAVVDRLVKGQGGVFLRLPDGARGYLRDRSGLSEGQRVLVQVSGVAEEGKAIPVTSRLLFRGRFGILTPGKPGVNVSRSIKDEDTRAALTALGEGLVADAPGLGEDCGLILRSAAGLVDDAEIRDELAPLVELAASILLETEGAPELLLDAPGPHMAAWVDWAEPAPDQVDEGEDAFDTLGVTEMVDALLSPEIALTGGGSALLQPTRALLAIDVNTGSDTSPAAGLKANIALARDLPRQLRLRGLGGQVVVDFAPMPKRDRATLEQVLRSAFKFESAETVLIGWTKMGLFEISRKRDRAQLAALAAAGGEGA
ncbi:ribonuclease E/G [Paracoccus zhejiangensis]|uniref:Ribonuclease G n=1 Tax=Paracoccus zhejiangensis TaxID=1077935 RepID=A0A2H5EY01_9RHOB|nr:ribonuclease E/G [Paracoccus zhejiangensis]AUH64154.1 ribonuclease G [Paracoccus zhejiangensis]